MNIAVILAAGKGTRVKNADKPKQFLEIGGKPILCHTVEKFLACKLVNHIVIAVHSDWILHTESLLSEYERGRISVCEGADNRQESLYKALIFCQEQLHASDETIIISHDAVRPFVTEGIINANIHAIQNAEMVTTVIPAIDTIVLSEDGLTMTSTTNRNQMFQVQTPQTFRLRQYIDIHQILDKMQIEQMTDVTGVFYSCGLPVVMIRGERKNIKVTTNEDLCYIEYLLRDFPR